MKKLFAMSALIAAALLFYSASTGVSANSDKFRRSTRAIPNRYIVVLDEQAMSFAGMAADLVIDQLGREFNGRMGHIYSSALNGYSVEMTEKEAERLSQDPRVKYVEEDAVVVSEGTQINAEFGLDRIDQRMMPMDAIYNYPATGAGVNVYVIDSGILLSHPDFQGRAFLAYDVVHDPTPIDQCNGHGTNVAGIIGSATFGVAKQANMHSVVVIGCQGYGTLSDVIQGVDWVTRHAVRPAVANMSLGGDFSSSLNDAVAASISAGITYAVAAGNETDDACRHSPASVASALTVGASTRLDERLYNTNFGRCVDIFAPGLGVATTGVQAQYPSVYVSGTSFSSPYVAGTAALYLESHPTASSQDVSAAIVNNGTPGVVANAGTNSPNLLLYSVFSNANPTTCAGNMFEGTIAVPGEMQYQSSSSGFSARTGRVNGNLSVPLGARFKLSLESKKGGRWSVVAESSGTSQEESVSTRIKSGTFRWRVTSLEATGLYDLCSVTP